MSHSSPRPSPRLVPTAISTTRTSTELLLSDLLPDSPVLATEHSSKWIRGYPKVPHDNDHDSFILSLLYSRILPVFSFYYF